jgi:hypothetical protein
MTEMTPYEFFDAFVYWDYKDWQDERNSIRKAFHAAVSASHLADYYCRYHQRTNAAFQLRYGDDWLKDDGLTKFRCALQERELLFKPIHDMALAFKHLYPRARCDVSSGGEIENVQCDDLEIDHDLIETASL